MVGKHLIDINKDENVLKKKKDKLTKFHRSFSDYENPPYEISFDENTNNYKLWKIIE